MNKINVMLTFEISTEGFESREAAAEFYLKNYGDLVEALDFTDEVTVAIDSATPEKIKFR